MSYVLKVVSNIQLRMIAIRSVERQVINRYFLQPNPRAFLDLKIALQVTPLAISDYRISNSKRYSDDFKNRLGDLPLFTGFIPGAFGLWGIGWGWWNLRHGQCLPASISVFAGGCLLWACACLVVLPWSIS